MVEIAPSLVTWEDVGAWHAAKLEVKKWQNIENLLRPKIFKHFFPLAEEGTNNYTLPDGFILKGNRVISREVDPAAVDAFSQPGPNGEPSKFAQAKINSDNLLRRKLELKVGEYRKLTAEELKVMDQCLIIKDGMPGLEIAPPSSRNQQNAKRG